MRTSNPALNNKTFQTTITSTENPMTIQGTVNKTGICLALLFVSASWTWGKVAAGAQVSGALWLPVIGAFIVAMVTCFKKEWAPVTAPLYAVMEGAALGFISALFELRFPGIVIQAVSLTFGTLAALLMAYKSGLIRATENFKLGVFAATGGIALLYLVDIVIGFFGLRVPFIHESGMFGIGFSVFVVVVAALNLVLDFDFIEKGASQGAPKYMEWYAAFGLMVTLVWLYFEILRLLAKMRERR